MHALRGKRVTDCLRGAFARRPGMRNDAGMRCDVAREALSARLDGERPQVLAQQVDAHLESCGRCRAWLIGAAVQTRRLASIEPGQGPDLADKIMASLSKGSTAPYHRWMRALRWRYRRWGLIGVGVFQVAIAAAQIGGIDFGMVSHTHGAMSGEHLMHESTAWLLALGLAMIAAGIWTVAAIGVAAIVGAYSLALVGYEVVDAFEGEETAARIASHVPLLVGFAFALLVARERMGARRPRTSDATDEQAGIAARPTGRRHGHLRPINRSIAASTTTSRRLSEPAELRWMAMTASSDDEAVTALALAAARGNERALEAFIKATQQDVWRFVTYLSDAGNADDLTQETFLRAIGAIERFSRTVQRPNLAAGHRAPCRRRPHPPRSIATPHRPRRLSRAPAQRRPPRPRIRRPRRSDHDDRRPYHRTTGSPVAHPAPGAALRRRRGGVWLPGGHHPIPRRPRPGCAVGRRANATT